MTENNASTLPIMEYFYTIQGEGFHSGRAAYFIRLLVATLVVFGVMLKKAGTLVNINQNQLKN